MQSGEKELEEEVETERREGKRERQKRPCLIISLTDGGGLWATPNQEILLLLEEVHSYKE